MREWGKLKGLKRGQFFLRYQPNSPRANFLRKLLAERGMTEEQFLKLKPPRRIERPIVPMEIDHVGPQPTNGRWCPKCKTSKNPKKDFPERAFNLSFMERANGTMGRRTTPLWCWNCHEITREEELCI